VVGDLGASLGRGALGAGEMVMRGVAGASELLGVAPEEGEPNRAREIGKDIAGYRDDTIPVSREAQADPVRKAWTGGVESATTSLLAVAPAVTLGVLTGGAGAAAAGYLMGAPMFGAAQYDQSLEEFTKKGVPKDEAHMAALMMGASEAGFEFVTDALEIATVGFGGLVTKPLKDAAKNSVKRTITSSWGEAIKRGVAIKATETVGESMNVGTQAEIERNTGVADQRFWGAIKDQFGQIAVAGMIFGAIGGGLHKARSSHVKGLITDKAADPEERLGAVQEIYQEIARTDPGLADRWRTGATMAVLHGKAISEDIEDVQEQPPAAPAGSAGEDTTVTATAPAPAKRKKTAAEILTGRTAPIRQAPEVGSPKAEGGMEEPVSQPPAYAEAITGRRVPMRQPSQAPVEMAQQAPAEAVQPATVVEDVGRGALPEVVEEQAQVADPWQMPRSEFAKTSTVNRGNNYLAVRSPDGSTFIIRTLDTAKYTDADAIEASHKDYIKKAIEDGKPVPPEVLAEYPDLVEKPKTTAAETITGRPHQTAPDQTIEDDKTAGIAREEIAREEARDDVAARAAEPAADILNKDGQPYKNANAARFALRGKKLEGSHDVVAVAGGYALRPRAGQSPIGEAAQESKPAAAATKEKAEGGRLKAEGKEPWEMSRSEFAKTSTVNRGNNYLSVSSPDGSAFTIRTLDTAKYTDAEAIALSHKDYIKKAIENGKPVPAEVLAEYPDLIEKPKTDAAATITGKKAVQREQEKTEPVEGAAADQAAEAGAPAAEVAAPAGARSARTSPTVRTEKARSARTSPTVRTEDANPIEIQPKPLAEIMVNIKAYSESGAAMIVKERADVALSENAEQATTARKILECLNI
jgi:hypothetical protein